MTERSGTERTLVATGLIVTGSVIGGLALLVGLAVLVGKAIRLGEDAYRAEVAARQQRHEGPTVLLGVVHPGLPYDSAMAGEPSDQA